MELELITITKLVTQYKSEELNSVTNLRCRIFLKKTISKEGRGKKIKWNNREGEGEI